MPVHNLLPSVMKTNTHHFRLTILILERFLQSTISSTLDDKFIAIAINLTIVFAEIVNFAPNNYFYTFASPPWRNPGYAPACCRELFGVVVVYLKSIQSPGIFFGIGGLKWEQVDINGIPEKLFWKNKKSTETSKQ